jgi:hypothetical protein
MIDAGFFVMQAAAIRRLLDKSPISGPRGVYSLHALIRDIIANADLLTRQNVLLVRGLEYDFEPIKLRAYEILRGPGVAFISRDGWADAEHWHGVVDQLSGVTPEQRSPSDTPDRSKLVRLLEELESRGRIVHQWADKFVAHAASPESRQTLHPDDQSLSLAKLWLAERVLIRASSFVAHYFISGTNLGGVPIPQFDQFVYLDRPFIQPTALEAMHRAWDRHSDEVRSCENWFWDKPLVDASDQWGEETATRAERDSELEVSER